MQNKERNHNIYNVNVRSEEVLISPLKTKHKEIMKATSAEDAPLGDKIVDETGAEGVALEGNVDNFKISN